MRSMSLQCNAPTLVLVNVIQRCIYSTWYTIFKGLKMNRSCLCVCFATIRLLFNVSRVILQRLSIFTRFISFNLQCFTIVHIPCINISRTTIGNKCCCTNTSSPSGGFLYTPYTGIYFHLYRYIYPFWLARTFVPWIAGAPNVKSYRQTFNCPFTWSLTRSYRFILQHSLSLYNNRIWTQDISQNLMRLDRTAVALDCVKFVRILSHMRLLRQQFTIHI